MQVGVHMSGMCETFGTDCLTAAEGVVSSIPLQQPYQGQAHLVFDGFAFRSPPGTQAERTGNPQKCMPILIDALTSCWMVHQKSPGGALIRGTMWQRSWWVKKAYHGQS